MRLLNIPHMSHHKKPWSYHNTCIFSANLRPAFFFWGLYPITTLTNAIISGLFDCKLYPTGKSGYQKVNNKWFINYALKLEKLFLEVTTLSCEDILAWNFRISQNLTVSLMKRKVKIKGKSIAILKKSKFAYARFLIRKSSIRK